MNDLNNNTKADLKLECLKLAADKSTTTKEIVENAQLYWDFINKEEDKKEEN